MSIDKKLLQSLIKHHVKWRPLAAFKRKGQWFIKCMCVCGKKKDVHKANILQGKSKSCKSCSIRTHGKSYERVYNIW